MTGCKIYQGFIQPGISPAQRQMKMSGKKLDYDDFRPEKIIEQEAKDQQHY